MGFFNFFKPKGYHSSYNNYYYGFDEYDIKKFSDEQLINHGYASNSDVYSIIKLISTVGSNIPLLLINSSNGNKEIITDGDVYDLFKMPQDGLSIVEFIEQSLVYILTSGDLYYLKESSIGFNDLNLRILPSSLVDIHPSNSIFNNPTTYILNDKQKQLKISSEDIIHIKYLDPSNYGIESYKGLSPLQASRYSMVSSKDIQIAKSNMVKNQGVRGILTNRSDRPLTPEEKNDVQEVASNKLMGLKNFNRIYATTGNMDFISMGMSASDLKMIESGLVSLRQLCNAYNVSSRLLNDPENTTFNNVKEAEKSLYTRAIFPTLENKIIWTLNNTWMKDLSEKFNGKFKIQIDKSKIEALQTDQILESQKNNELANTMLSILKEDITRDQKIQILITAYSLTEEEATNIIGNV